MLVVSAAAHAAAVAALLVAGELEPRSRVGPSVVTVDLVAPPPRRAPPPPPAAAPAPEPAPAPRRVARRAPSRVVLPAQPTRTAEPPKEAAEAPEPAAEPAPESYDELLERLRAERGEDRPEAREVASLHPTAPEPAPAPAARPAPVAPAPSAVAPGGGGAPAPPEVVAWLRDARVHVQRVWVLPPGMRFEPLVARVEVHLDAQGRVLGEPRITDRSGNPWYDESVVRAIEKASPLPAPPEAGEWPFVFRPEDIR
jgi:TonB family protein